MDWCVYKLCADCKNTERKGDVRGTFSIVGREMRVVSLVAFSIILQSIACRVREMWMVSPVMFNVIQKLVNG